ncbi:glycine--tRNA ligase subunit beta [Sphingomonas baiyangensis]|uniref:glycine--tRNA ligase subunit beta n=1 Tax=Sphingomonas baiyangensis TaxID=2572576 RepID=UPI00146E8A31|nr:glycine--tRNA ligase subunit beta [Sphingomonas baiyangensis]
MTDFLLELRSEEIPARMQDRARADLEKLFVAELAKAGIAAAGIVTYATPRRLALIARGLPQATEAVREEMKGPRTSAPEAALEGFLRKTGLARDALTERDGIWFAVTEKPGRATGDVLAAAIPAIVRAFPWPKSMRWGDASRSTESMRWVRPLQGIVAIFGEKLVPCEIAGIESGYATLGHRFHAPGPITLGGAHDYVEKLRACHVIVDQDERRALIRERATALAADAGLTLVEDEGLVAENAGLTEWPVPLLGRFDPGFLSVPPEVIQLTARVNQKYFVLETSPRNGEGDRPAQPDGGGVARARQLTNAFICVANIDAKDGGAKIVAGNQKVLAARLSDARFFYDTDLKLPLDEQAKKLEKIVFHEKLGTVADKVERVAKLARWLVEEGIVPAAPLPGREGPGVGDGAQDRASKVQPTPNPSLPGRGDLADMAERAARLAKADLVTGMVGEFPELQGLMGGYYARAQGEPTEVWEAVRDHYKPVGQDDEVPTAPVTVAVSLADKLDTIVQFYIENMPPTGSKDPFALRRAALAVIAIVVRKSLRFRLERALLAACEDDLAKFEKIFFGETEQNLARFFADRLKVQQREAGVRHDLIDAVFALGGEDDLVRLLARVHALQAFVTTPEGANLLAGYKRAANILKKEGVGETPPRHPGLVPGSTAPQAASAGERAEPPATLDAAAAASEPFGTESPRTPAEQRIHAIDRDGAGIPQTGEEDPLVEVDTDRGFAPVVAAFAASEHAPGSPGGASAQNSLSYTPEKAETDLVAALDAAEPAAAQAVADEDFEAAMAALAGLRAPIDAFFESVTVNDADPAKRQARLALLARVRAAVHSVADFSRIEG